MCFGTHCHAPASEAQLGNSGRPSALTMKKLCLSASTLYRLFAPNGGVAFAAIGGAKGLTQSLLDCSLRARSSPRSGPAHIRFREPHGRE